MNWKMAPLYATLFIGTLGLFLQQLFDAAAGVEISGTFHFSMAWDEFEDDLRHHVTVDGKTRDLPDSSDLMVNGKVRDLPDRSDLMVNGKVRDLPDRSDLMVNGKVRDLPDSGDLMVNGKVRDLPDSSDLMVNGKVRDLPDSSDLMVNGKVRDLPDRSDLMVNGKVRDLPDSGSDSEGPDIRSEAAGRRDLERRSGKGEKHTSHMKVFPFKARQRRSAAPNPFDESYTRHGSDCVKRLEAVARSHAAHTGGGVTKAGSKHEDGEEIQVAPGVPGIPEAPPVFAENKGEDLQQRHEAGPEGNAVALGQDGRPKEKARRVHIAVLVEEAEEARLACHYCSGPGEEDQPKGEVEQDKSRTSMIWYHLSRRKQFGVYRITEVPLDMHDDAKLDRIYVTASHTLVIREARLKHQGSYFCRTVSDTDDVSRTRLSEQDLAKFLRGSGGRFPNQSSNPARYTILHRTTGLMKVCQRDDKLRFLYHLDIVKVSQVKARLVRLSAEENTGLPLPAPPANVSEVNVKVLSVWQEWSLCSSCGTTPGTRRRIGQCTVQREPEETPDSHFSFFGILLALYKDGVPCRSSLFHGHEVLADHVTRPDELQEQECRVSCDAYSVKMREILAEAAKGKHAFKTAGQARQKVKVKERHFVEPEGDALTIKCPRAPLDMPVAWMNGTRILIGPLLHRITNGRVKVNERNDLCIKKLLLADAGHYACVVAGRVRGRIRLEVTPLPAPCKSCRYALYLVMTFAFDFLVFCTVAYVKHQERKRVLNYDLLGSLSDSGTDESSDEGSDEGGDESSNALQWKTEKGGGGGGSGDTLVRLLEGSEDNLWTSVNLLGNDGDLRETRGHGVTRHGGGGGAGNANTDGGDGGARFATDLGGHAFKTYSAGM